MSPSSTQGHVFFRTPRSIDWLFLAGPCLLLGTLLLVCWVARLDVPISHCFYGEADNQWPLAKVEPFKWCYHCGCKPAVCLGVIGLVLGLVGLCTTRLHTLRTPGLFLALTLIVGPGVLVNAVLKPQVGRPRPYETTPFGGERPFAYYGASTTGNNSFPSGHASMGFFFMTPALLIYRVRPRLAMALLTAGGAYGMLVGVSRIVQGAHFASDVIGSALIVYASGVVVLVAAKMTRRVLDYWAAQRLDDGPRTLSFPTLAERADLTRRAA